MLPSPKLSYLCLFENPSFDAGRALIRQFVLVREADRMGYDEIWLGEHHGDPVWPSSASGTLLGHLAAVTQHARIGTLATQIGARDALQCAADLTTADLLSKGRLQWGVSCGLPFSAAWQPQTSASSRQSGDAARERVLEVRRWWSESRAVEPSAPVGEVAHLVPPAARDTLPTWVATTSEEGVAWAARHGLGLMAGATSTVGRLQRLKSVYAAASDGADAADPRMVLARFAFPAESREEARDAARPYLEAFVQRMRAQGVHAHAGDTVTFDVEALMDQSLIGSYQDVADHITRLQEEVGIHSVAVIPTSAHFDTVKRVLADLVDEVRPLLPDY